MRTIVVILFLTVFLYSAFAGELGNQPSRLKDNTHVGQNPGSPDGRNGGETIETAVPIESLPFFDQGNTSDNINHYDVQCPYGGSLSPDVVFSYLPTEDGAVSVDLCGSGYDTAIWVFDADHNLIACNDDYYLDEECGNYCSFIESVDVLAGVPYFYVVDGYGSDSGDYTLAIDFVYPPEPCDLICDGIDEGEPPLVDGYSDLFNTGCNDESGVFPFQALQGDNNGELDFCGKSGWYNTGGELRDTDWFTAIVGATGVVEWTADAEEECSMFQLGPLDCTEVGVLFSAVAGPCEPATLMLQGAPGEVLWLWVGPSVYAPPEGFEGNEFDYICFFVGLEDGVVTTDRVSFDRVKSLYR